MNVSGRASRGVVSMVELRHRDRFEWPTWALLILCYALWTLGTTWVSGWWLPAGMVLVALSAALHSSLCHEALHGHPTPYSIVNEALVFPALSLFVPYRRFVDTHLAHHNDEVLTDPYDDPESNYLDPQVWRALPRWRQWILLANNTLLGRLVIGPAIGLKAFTIADWRAIRNGDRRVRNAWVCHIPAVAVVIWWVEQFGQMPIGSFILSTYAAHSILKIRTFLEHRAHERPRARTAVIEDRGPFALLFLNNNLHVVHHMHPSVAWYKLPRLYRRHRAHYLSRNDTYLYQSYGEVFRRYFFQRKDPVSHPIWRRR